MKLGISFVFACLIIIFSMSIKAIEDDNIGTSFYEDVKNKQVSGSLIRSGEESSKFDEALTEDFIKDNSQENSSIMNDEEAKAINKAFKEDSAGKLKFSKALNPAHMGVDMLRFYTVVGILDYHKCMTTRDESICRAFVESMKDPAHHVGFALFMIANGWTSTAFLKLSKGTFSGGQLGLAVGMMAQDLFTEFFVAGEASVEVKKAFDTYWNAASFENDAKRSFARKDALSNIWKFSFGKASWRFDKLLNIVSLISASLASQASMTMLQLGYRLVRWKTHGDEIKLAFSSLSEFGSGKRKLKILKIGFKGVKLLFGGLARAPIANNYIGALIKVGTYLISTSLFLNYAEYFAFKITDHFKTRDHVKNIVKINQHLQNQTNDKTIHPMSASHLKSSLNKLSESWDNYRASLLRHALEIKSRHESELHEFDTQWIKAFNYSNWLVSLKGDQDHVMWRKNVGGWHQTSSKNSGNFVKDLIIKYQTRKIELEILKYSQGAFCGGNPLESIVSPDFLDKSSFLPLKAGEIKPIAFFIKYRPKNLCVSDQVNQDEINFKLKQYKHSNDQILGEMPLYNLGSDISLAAYEKLILEKKEIQLHKLRMQYLQNLSKEEHDELIAQNNKSLSLAYVKYVYFRKMLENGYVNVMTPELIKSFTGEDIKNKVKRPRNTKFVDFKPVSKITFSKSLFFDDSYKKLINYKSLRPIIRNDYSYTTNSKAETNSYWELSTGNSKMVAGLNFPNPKLLFMYAKVENGILPSFYQELKEIDKQILLFDGEKKDLLESYKSAVLLKRKVSVDLLAWFRLPRDIRNQTNPHEIYNYNDEESFQLVNEELQFLKSFYLSM